MLQTELNSPFGRPKYQLLEDKEDQVHEVSREKKTVMGIGLVVIHVMFWLYLVCVLVI